MPWLTPPSNPATVSRVVFYPNDVEWWAVIIGALFELTDPDNWEQSPGGITPEEAAQAMADALKETLLI